MRFIGCATALCVIALCAGCSNGPSPDILPHLISEPESAPVRAIDGREETAMSAVTGELNAEQYSARVEELYTVVYEGGKPVFAPDDPVKPVYDAAIEMLDTYMLNSWRGNVSGELNTVHTIHDWLVYNVAYDFELYERYQKGESVEHDRAFDISGVFLNKRAVCDGLSDAVDFLCAIEGISSMRVTGQFEGVPHAWNKVRIGGAWYNMDVTADAFNYNVDGGEFRKQISHGFFLLSDDTLRTFKPAAHIFSVAGGSAAIADHDYYANKQLNIGGKSYNCTVRSQAELNAVFSAVSAQKGAVGKLELKLDFPDKANVNDKNMYEAEIAEAYSKLRSPDFSAASKPYYQYPNGVYLFLMYK